jgi:hypothetical protein
MFSFARAGEGSARKKAYLALRRLVTAKTYGFDDRDDTTWNLTDMIRSTDARKHMVYAILDGVNWELKYKPGILPMQEADGSGPFTFRLKVLTRQACCRTHDGHKIWERDEALTEFGSDGDIVAEFGDAPQPGDIVEWKNQWREVDEDSGRDVDAAMLNEWAARGIRPESYVEFVVDKDGCISVPYPFSLMMLRKRGKNLTFPKFRKKNRAKPRERKLINWWFEEVPKDFRAPRKRT